MNQNARYLNWYILRYFGRNLEKKEGEGEQLPFVDIYENYQQFCAESGAPWAGAHEFEKELKKYYKIAKGIVEGVAFFVPQVIPFPEPNVGRNIQMETWLQRMVTEWSLGTVQGFKAIDLKRFIDKQLKLNIKDDGHDEIKLTACEKFLKEADLDFDFKLAKYYLKRR